MHHYTDPQFADDRYDILRDNTRRNDPEGLLVLTRCGSHQLRHDWGSVVTPEELAASTQV